MDSALVSGAKSMNKKIFFQDENSAAEDEDIDDDEDSKSSETLSNKTEPEQKNEDRAGSRSSALAPGWFGKGRRIKKQRP